MTAQSLLQIVKAPLHPSPLAKSVLIIIDAQLEYLNGKLPLDGIDSAIVEASKLLKLARNSGVPVFHVVHHGAAGAPLFDETTPQGAIIPLLTPAAGEVVVRKTLPNSFAGTDLDALVKSTGRSELILAGYMTHMCVSATARAALDLKYRTTIVANAAATRDLPDPLGGVIPASVVHRVALSELADRFAIVVKDTAALTAAAAVS
ncbi:MAG TPA: cysteine hydrolase family protein [Afipia sp.]